MWGQAGLVINVGTSPLPTLLAMSELARCGHATHCLNTRQVLQRTEKPTQCHSVCIVTLSNVLNTEVKRYDRIIYFRINEMSGDDDFHLGLILSGLIVLLLGAIYLLSRIWLSEWGTFHFRFVKCSFLSNGLRLIFPKWLWKLNWSTTCMQVVAKTKLKYHMH